MTCAMQAKRQPLSAFEANSLMKQLLEALAFLHPHFFHRDIKPVDLK